MSYAEILEFAEMVVQLPEAEKVKLWRVLRKLHRLQQQKKPPPSMSNGGAHDGRTVE